MRLAVATLLLLAACARKPSLSDTPAGRARLLALSDPGAGLPIDKSIEELQALLQRSADRAPIWLSLGQAWIVEARDAAAPAHYTNAAACAEVVLSFEPDNRAALELQAVALMGAVHLDEAREKLSALLARFPDDASAWGTLSDVLVEMGRTPQAISAAEKMLALRPQMIAAHTRAAYLEWLLGDIAGARSSVQRALGAARPGEELEATAWAWTQSGNFAWHEGDLASAQSAFESALKTLPDFPPALVGEARLAIGRGDGAAASSLLERAWQISPQVETGWLLGDARELAGDAAGAQRIWMQIEERGRALDPQMLALFLATKNLRPDEALDLAQAARKQRADIDTHDALAWALYRKSPARLNEALAASEEALALGTRDARLWFHAGAIRLALGDASGRGYLERALALNPQFDRSGAAEARKLLAGR